MSAWLWAVLIVAVGNPRRSDRDHRHPKWSFRRSTEPARRPNTNARSSRAGDRETGEAELRARQARHDELELRPLAPLARKGFMDAWQGTQAEFVDDPVIAISDADRLIQSVMRDRGYPIEDFDDRASLVSVDHPRVVERYRRAHAIAVANSEGDTAPKTCGIAMQDYRALFEELVGETANA